MKIKSLIAAINKDIEETSKRKVTLLDEITRTKDQLADITSQIQNYDSSDISGFKELKDNQAFYEHHIEMLERKLSESKNLDDARIKEDMASFRSERTEIMKKLNKELIPVVEKLDAIHTEASYDLSELRKVYDLWRRTYNLQSDYQIQSFFLGIDNKNILGNVRSFVDRMKELTKD